MFKIRKSGGDAIPTPPPHHVATPMRPGTTDHEFPGGWTILPRHVDSPDDCPGAPHLAPPVRGHQITEITGVRCETDAQTIHTDGVHKLSGSAATAAAGRGGRRRFELDHLTMATDD